MKKINRNLFFLIVIMIVETIFLKTFMYDILPKKYFFDANHILGVMKGISATDKSYSYVANIFNRINFFNLTSVKEWGYAISIIFVPIIIVCLRKEKKYSIGQTIFIFASYTLLNIYVLGISKDIIQFVYFLLLYLIVSNKKIKNTKKIILSCIVLLIEALLFRVYYAIMAMLIVTIYFVYIRFIRNKEINKKQFFKILVISLFLFFTEVFLVQLISYDNYDAILNARYSVNIWRANDDNANTIINDLLGKNTNYFKFIGNYLINFVRLMLPVELIFKGVKQILFMIYQFTITSNLAKSCKKIDDENCLWIIFVLSFIMISVIFEPDFGSFVRHETTMMLFLLEIMKINRKENNNVKEKN